MRGLADLWPGGNSIYQDYIHPVLWIGYMRLQVFHFVSMIHVDENNSGRRCARVGGVSLGMFSAGRISLMLTGCSVGGLVDLV